MKNRSSDKIKLTSIDELLGVVNEESAMEIEIRKIHSFADHPFKVMDDEKMDELVESIKANGVLSPVLVRPDDEGTYEMISGHRRLFAVKQIGLDRIPAMITTNDGTIVTAADARWNNKNDCGGIETIVSYSKSQIISTKIMKTI